MLPRSKHLKTSLHFQIFENWNLVFATILHSRLKAILTIDYILYLQVSFYKPQMYIEVIGFAFKLEDRTLAIFSV